MPPRLGYASDGLVDVDRRGTGRSFWEGSDVLDDAEGDRLRGEPYLLEDPAPLCVLEEPLRDGVQPERRVHAGGVERLQQHGAAAAGLAVVLDAHDQPVL